MNIRTIATIALCTWLAACSNTPAPTSSDAKNLPKAPDAKTMSCGEFIKLDQPARIGVVKELTPKPPAGSGQQSAEAVEPMATALCKSMPDHKVAELLLSPPAPSPTPSHTP
jgi:hypothetical protein